MSGLIRSAIAERRAIAANFGNPQDPAYWVLRTFGIGTPSTSGVPITPKSALHWTPISAGVRMIAETVGSLSWSVFEGLPQRDGGEGRSLPGGAKERTDHPLYPVLHAEPNEEMTSMEYFGMAQAHALWWGGSPSQIVRDNRGVIKELWPLNPDRCRWEREADDSLWLRVTLPKDDQGGVSGSTRFPAREILWVPGFSIDGLWGVLLPTWHQEAIGLGLATELFQAAFFGRGAMPSGVLSHPSKVLSEEAKKRLREAMENQVTGLDRAHRTLILEEGWQWTQTSIDPNKAQLQQLRQFQIGEAARILRIPPHLLGDLERATFSNIEQQAIEFVQHTIRSWVVRWEQRLNKQLFAPAEKGKLFTRANMNALIRGDMAARYAAYAVAIQNRILSPNEVRELEDLNPGPKELDQYQESANVKAPAPPPPKGVAA